MSGRESCCGFLNGKPISDLICVAPMNALFLNMNSCSITNDERCAILHMVVRQNVSLLGDPTLIVHHLASIPFPDKDLSIILSIRRIHERH